MDFAATNSRGRSDDDRWQHAIFVVDQSNQITDANHAAQLLTAKSKVDLIGTQITQWLDLGDDHSRAEVQPGQHQGHSYDAAKSVMLRNSDGETQAIHLTLSRFPVGESGLTIFVASERSDPDQMPEHARLDNHASTDGNAAGQVPTEQQVIEQERLRVAGILATGMAHDIANILSPAIVFAYLVVDQGVLSSPQSQQLKRIQRCVEDIGAIVDRFKRLGQPPAVPRYSQVVLSDFLQSVAE
ncbi:MAG: hypothetical protein HKN47_19270, partial [Pirellulaceae bacterium]|nr:hypothetical protein [Pirellulaceae bacterium]